MQAAQERWAVSTKSEPVAIESVAYSDAPVPRATQFHQATIVASTFAAITFAITNLGVTPSEATTLASHKWASDPGLSPPG